MRRALLLAAALLALLAGALLLPREGPSDAGAHAERADEMPPETPPARLTGRGEEQATAVAGAPGIRPVSEAAISGVVVDGRDGRVVAGIRVEGVPVGGQGDGRSMEARTDEDGCFALGGLVAESYEVTAAPRRPREPPGDEPPYAPGFAWTVRAGTSGLVIRVEPALDLTGTIRVADRGAPGVLVRVLVQGSLLDDGPYRGPPFAIFSARDGAFRVPRLAPGLYDLRFVAGAYDGIGNLVVRGVRPGTTPVDVVMPVGAVLRACLVDEAGEAVTEPGRVYVAPQGTLPGGLDGMPVHVDLEGRFTAHRLARDLVYAVHTLGFDGYLPAVFDGIVPGGEEVVLRLRSAGSIAGRVLDEEGNPVGAGVPIVAEATDPPGEDGDAGGRSDETETDSDGWFELDRLRDHPFAVAAGGGETAWVAGELARDVRIGTDDLVLRVRRGVPLRGRLVDAAGRAIGEVDVEARARPRRLGAAHTTFVGPDGRFAFAGIPEGTVEIHLRRDGKTCVLGPFVAPAEDVEVVVRD